MQLSPNMAAPIENATSGLNLDTIDHLTDISEIRSALDALDEEEDSIGNDLDALLEHQRILETKMAGLQKMIPNLQLLEGDSKQLTDMISFTSTLAENVSSKVRQLDVAKSQVTGCLTRVEDILDLKFCTDGVQSSLNSEDYETAAGHIHRFRSLDENILRMTSDTAEGSQLEISFKLLHESEDKLRTIVHNKFDAAVHSGDLASVERFFKIFPLVGLFEEGLTKYGKFLASQLSERAEKDLKLALAMEGADDKRANVLYADTLTLLFESIAKVVDIQQPLVETYYGPGKLFILLKWIQRACDRHARKLVEEFKKKRDFDSKAQQVQQSMMFHKQANSEKLDPKDLDPLLSEVALLSTRTELYLRFMRRRSTADMEIGEQLKDTQKERESEIETFFTNCELSCLMQEQIGTYIMMEEYFMREMVLKAVSMDSTEDGMLTSSMVDDTFFIVKKCVRRSISSRSVDGVCAMLNHACTTLEQDFREVLFSQLRSGFPSGFHLSHAYNLVQSSLQSGKIQSSDTEKEKAKTTFLVSLNNSETSCDYLQKLKGSLEEEVSKAFHTNEQSQAKLETCLSDLSAVSNRLREAVEFGFSQLQSSAVKPRIKPIVETFLSTNHNITEDEFSNYEANDPWVQNFIVSLDTLLATFKSSLTSPNYDTFVTLVTNEITTSLEKSVMKSVFNRLGGLQFDKELRSLVAYLTSVTTWTIRDKFARLTQMATILNMEKVTEIVDYWGPNSGPLTWRLTPTEVRQILSLRMDFRSEDIKRLKL